MLGRDRAASDSLGLAERRLLLAGSLCPGGIPRGLRVAGPSSDRAAELVAELLDVSLAQSAEVSASLMPSLGAASGLCWSNP